MKKSKKLPIQFKIDEADEKKLKQKMEDFGFHTFTSFYSFITKHILEDNVSVHIEPEKKWSITPEYEKQLEKILKEPTTPIHSVKDLLKEIDGEIVTELKVQTKT